MPPQFEPIDPADRDVCVKNLQDWPMGLHDQPTDLSNSVLFIDVRNTSCEHAPDGTKCYKGNFHCVIASEIDLASIPGFTEASQAMPRYQVSDAGSVHELTRRMGLLAARGDGGAKAMADTIRSIQEVHPSTIFYSGDDGQALDRLRDDEDTWLYNDYSPNYGYSDDIPGGGVGTIPVYSASGSGHTGSGSVTGKRGAGVMSGGAETSESKRHHGDDEEMQDA